MQFSSRTAIAVHILLAIQVFEGQYKTTSAFLSGSLNVNPVIIRNTLGQLKSAGIVKVKAGEGGASLARAAEEITLLDIFRAVEKEESLFHYHEAPNPRCPVGRNIRAVLDDKLGMIESEMFERMRSVTLEEMSRDMRERIQSDAAGQ